MSFGKWEVNVSFNSMPQPVATAMAKLNDTLIGAKYNAIAYLGSQVVNGTNYAVLAEQTLTTNDSEKNIVTIVFNRKPGDLDATLVGIDRVLTGGAEIGGIHIDVQTDIPEDIQKIWYDCLEGYVGYKFTPIAFLGTQVVNGANYYFVVEATPVVEHPETDVVIAVVNPTADRSFSFVSILNDKANNAPTLNTKNETGNKKLKMSSPWVTYAREIHEMFGYDPEIRVEYLEDKLEVRLYVENSDKADAIAQLLPPEKYFGGVSLKITVIPANRLGSQAKTLFDRAFSGNPVFAHTTEFQGLYNQPMTYVVFKKRVVQYFSDNLGDEHALTSTLYQNIAQDLFDTSGVYYCTDIEDPVYNDGKSFGAPLGEWP